MSTTSRQVSPKRPNQKGRKKLVSVDGPGRDLRLIPQKPLGMLRPDTAGIRPKGQFGGVTRAERARRELANATPEKSAA